MTEIIKHSADDNSFEVGSSVTLVDLEDPGNTCEIKCASGRWEFHTKPKYICLHHLGTKTVNEDDCVVPIHEGTCVGIDGYAMSEHNCIALIDTDAYNKYIKLHNEEELYNKLIPKKGDFNLFENGISAALDRNVEYLTIKGIMNENKELVLIKLIPMVDEDCDNPFKDEYPVHSNSSFEKFIKDITVSKSSDKLIACTSSDEETKGEQILLPESNANRVVPKPEIKDEKDHSITSVSDCKTIPSTKVLDIVDLPAPNSNYALIDDEKFMNFVVDGIPPVFCRGKFPFDIYHINVGSSDLVSKLIPLNENEIKELKDIYGLNYKSI